MVTLCPAVAWKLLADVAPGSLIQFGDLTGFCARDPHGTHVMVMHYPERNTFRLNITTEPVLDFGNEVYVIEELHSLKHDLLPSEGGTALFITSDGPKIVFATAGGPEGVRQLDLHGGQIQPVQRSGPVPAFTEWRVGVKSEFVECLILLAASPRHGGAPDDQGPLEPDEV